MDFNGQIVSGNELKKVKNIKSKTYLFKSIPIKLLSDYEKEGWVLDKTFKTKFRVKKLKPFDILFEDEVWVMLANLGFTNLNKDRQFRIAYSKGEGTPLTQQIDVFAADEETILLVECKATDSVRKGNFKETIEAIGGKKARLFSELRKKYPIDSPKIRIIFATKNYYLSEQDKSRLEQFDIIHFDEDIIQYYKDLAKHLGISARYQLLGNLFKGRKIPGINNLTPAIQGTMGGHKYFSFSIEPEKLLKIGYVLHRNKANKKLMPTYQRIIKKTRLLNISKFLENGGYFPNSVIINIETNGRNLRFDLAANQVENSITKIGILHLPQRYCSAFIIDGQHRLYGYSESKYKSTNSIPVVAFFDLDRTEQVKLFMEINENQKAVSKNLRNTLNADLLWDSEDLNEQRRAIKLQIAKSLGEEKSSPLYERIVIGENQPLTKHRITMDTIYTSLNTCDFLSKFKNNIIINDGTFDKGDSDATYDLLYLFFESSFEYIRLHTEEQWNRDKDDNGVLMTNAGIYSLIKIFNDIINLLLESKKIKTKEDSISKIVKEMEYYLDPLIRYFNAIPPDDLNTLKKSYGAAGRNDYWYWLRKVIAEEREDFKPDGLQDFIESLSKKYNTPSYEMICDIEGYLNRDFKETLETYHGENWLIIGLPKKVYDSINSLASDKKYENPEEDVQPWDCLNLIHYRDIAMYNWTKISIFEKKYTRPGEEKISGGKDAKTKWIEKLSKIRNKVSHHSHNSGNVTKAEYELLTEIYDWLLKES